jgi:hypothetical protein
MEDAGREWLMKGGGDGCKGERGGLVIRMERYRFWSWKFIEVEIRRILQSKI